MTRRRPGDLPLKGESPGHRLLPGIDSRSFKPSAPRPGSRRAPPSGPGRSPQARASPPARPDRLGEGIDHLAVLVGPAELRPALPLTRAIGFSGGKIGVRHLDHAARPDQFVNAPERLLEAAIDQADHAVRELQLGREREVHARRPEPRPRPDRFGLGAREQPRRADPVTADVPEGPAPSRGVEPPVARVDRERERRTNQPQLADRPLRPRSPGRRPSSAGAST